LLLAPTNQQPSTTNAIQIQNPKQKVREGCERSVITYSSLIHACEKGGQWELALQLFERMRRDHIPPNTVTFNSLILACAQGACFWGREGFRFLVGCSCYWKASYSKFRT
jgi:pentatricopeptide repeat protein